jgi:nicotinate phosphoribosyltransferase
MSSRSALLTDRYELTMLEAALVGGVADRAATFEVFGRGLSGRSYGVVAGTGRLASLIKGFRFGDEELAYLEEAGVCGQATLEYLRDFRFSGDIAGYPDGELYFPFSPILRVDAPFAEGLVLETLILSVLNFDSAIATAASRMRVAAGEATLIEMGSRRTHEEAAVAAARAAWIAGFDATSNLEAGRRYGIPTAGTMGHALVLAHPSEADAFRSQQAVMGNATTALVDTYDTQLGIRHAIEVFGPSLAAIRIDSGDPYQTAKRSRRLLDELGAHKTRIIVSGDLDESRILALQGAPIDGFGVGTNLVTGSGVPTAGFVYKLVAIEQEGRLVAVAKQSESKTSDGGRKSGYRRIREGRAIEEFSLDPEARIVSTTSDVVRPLEVQVIAHGEPVLEDHLDSWRLRHTESLAELQAPREALVSPDPLDALLSCRYLGPGMLEGRRS